MSEIRMKPYNDKYGEEWDRIFKKKTSEDIKDCIDEQNVDNIIVKIPMFDDDATYITSDGELNNEICEDHF